MTKCQCHNVITTMVEKNPTNIPKSHLGAISKEPAAGCFIDGHVVRVYDLSKLTQIGWIVLPRCGRDQRLHSFCGDLNFVLERFIEQLCALCNQICRSTAVD